MIAILETPTQLVLSGDVEDIIRLRNEFSYRPSRYWMSTQYQIWKRHQKLIKEAYASGEIALAQSLEEKHVGWDGYKNPIKMVYDDDGQFKKAVMLRGHVQDIIEKCEILSIHLDKTGIIKNPFESIYYDDIPDGIIAGTLDEHHWEIQKSCILSWLSEGMARNKVTVSGGKTAMFCAAAAMVKKRFPKARFLYFTPTERLVKQVSVEARKFLPEWHITQFGGETKDDSGRDMVVCTVSVLNRRFDELKKKKWFNTFFCLLIDECQYAASPTFAKVLKVCSAYFRFSASDTTKENNIDKHIILTGLTGRVQERVEAIDMIKINRIAVPTIDIVTVEKWRNKFSGLSSEPEIGSSAWALIEGEWKKGTYEGHVYELDENGDIRLDNKKNEIKVPGVHLISIDGEQFSVESRWCILGRKYDRAITSFTERNEMIAKIVSCHSNKGLQTLVIATRTLHVFILQSLIEAIVGEDKVKILYSAHSSEERDNTFNWFKTTPGAILISPLVKVGVSINEIQAGVVADFVADEEYMNQLIGRFIRKKPDGTSNTAEITVFNDIQHRSYANSCAKLFDKLKSIEGYKWRETNM